MDRKGKTTKNTQTEEKTNRDLNKKIRTALRRDGTIRYSTAKYIQIQIQVNNKNIYRRKNQQQIEGRENRPTLNKNQNGLVIGRYSTAHYNTENRGQH